MLQRDSTTQRLYLHDVVIENSQGMKPLTQTRPDANNVQVSRGQSRLDISTILLDALGVNTERTDSRKSRKSDADYLAAVERGDMETAQHMVDEAAKTAGYRRLVYHGSEAKEAIRVWSVPSLRYERAPISCPV